MVQESTPHTERLRGVLSKVRFASDDGQFAVCELEVDDRRLPITIVGNILATRPGESVEVTGRWQNDPTYGRQFRIESIRTVLPKNRDGIEKYLASDMMEGIGPTLASRIVDHFGESTLDIIDDDPARIAEVDGIGPKRAGRIIDSWQRDRLVHRLMVALRSHGISASLAVKIYERFGTEALDIVRRNPYRLAEQIRGVGFQTADEIARHFDIERDSPARLRAGLLHVLDRAHDDGHVFLPRPRLERRALELLGTDVGSLDDPLEQLKLSERIAVEPRDRNQPPAIYPIRAHRAETGAATHLRRLARTTGKLDFDDTDPGHRLDAIEQQLGIGLADAQRHAILSVFEQPLTVVTGGPGTGKTTIVQAICRLGDHFGDGVALAAPTGRAARRLSEATGREAQTIHRLLEFSFEKGGFQYDEERPLPVDILVIDEASMIDVYLLYSLVRAIPTGARLVFVGDIDQLPSVGPGQVLRDLIDSDVPGVTRLTEIFRQAEASSIVVNAHRINNGEIPVDPRRDDGELVDFYTINASSPEAAGQRIVDLATGRIPDAFGLDPLDDIQILSPMYRGEVGCDRLNERLQELFCGDRPGLERGSTTFRRGDRVMQTRNNYEDDVFNGDIGRVTAVDLDDEMLVVSFDDRRVKYKKESLDQLTLAYAITVHKSQGSEYPAVVIPVMTQHYVMLQRNLLYTAVTRGRRLVVLVGTKRAVRIAVDNDEAADRYTRLAARLRRQH